MATFEDPNMMASMVTVITTDQRQQQNQLARLLTFSIENILDPMDNINTKFCGHRPPALPTPTCINNNISHIPKQHPLFHYGHDSCFPPVYPVNLLSQQQQINHMDVQSIFIESENSLCNHFNALDVLESGAF